VFFGIKKKTRAWGTVYNSLTKQPLPYTKIQLLGKDFRVLEARITDREGRYGFLINASGVDPEAEFDLQILPARGGFRFPSTNVTGTSDTVLYERVYNGGIVSVHPRELIKFDIPMDPIQEQPLGTGKLPRIKLYHFWLNISHAFFWIGLFLVPLTYILNPTVLNLVVLIVFGALNLFIVIGDLRQRPYGIVVDQSLETPVPYSLITLQDSQRQRKGFTVSDEHGRYFLLSPKGDFTITTYTPAQVSPPRSREEPLSTDRGWIAKKLNL